MTRLASPAALVAERQAACRTCTSIGLLSWRPGYSHSRGRARRQYVRRIASNCGDSMTVRSFAHLPWRTWISIRLLSISATLRLTASEARKPAA